MLRATSLTLFTMPLRRRRYSFRITCFVLICGFTIVFLLRKMDFIPFGKITQKTPSIKPFLYLTQTEQCLPANLASPTQIGDPNTCRCDVIVLSYRRLCQENRFSHVTYLFDPQTTWSSGRNVAFFAAIARKPGYDYYVFLDDDTILQFNNFTPPAMKQFQPFRVVESWLEEYEPAVGVLDYKNHNGAKVVLERRQRLCGTNDSPLVIPTVRFDPIFNAFHRNALEHLLPYPKLYDTVSWDASNKRIISAVELKFRGQALLFTPVTAGNPKHRPYLKTKENMNEMWREMIDEIRRETPAIYKNRDLFVVLKRDLMSYVENSLTYCMQVKRHQPIVPYAHFEKES